MPKARPQNSKHNTILGLLAGGGTLPVLVAKALRARKQPFCVLAYPHTHTDAYQDSVHTVVGLGQVGQALKFLKKNAVTHIVMAGHFKRPRLSALKVDAKGALWLAGLMRLSGGDDALLRFIADKLSQEGFQVLAPQNVLTALTQSPGDLTVRSLDPQVAMDVARGRRVLDVLSSCDVGQAVVVQDGVVLGVEAFEGTSALIARCGALAEEMCDNGQREQSARAYAGPVLVKQPKIAQDRRLDPPVVGIQTLQALCKHGFSGVAIAAHGTLVLDVEQCIQMADSAGLFIHAYPVEGR